MIAETDKAIYEKLSSLEIAGEAIPVRFMGQEEQFGQNVNWEETSPYYCLQRYDITFADDRRWSADDKTVEFNYAKKTAIIKEPDFPMYLYYQIDCMARMQRDLTSMIGPLMNALPPEGYLSVHAYGKSHVNGVVITESLPLNEFSELNKWRHAIRYRVNIRLQNLTEVEVYLVLARVIREYRITDGLMRTIEIEA